MAIRPTDVRRKEFKSGFRGYDANEVDDFLDEVADEFERAFAENQRMTEELTSLRERLEQFEDLESAIRETLVQAQQVARDLRQNAGKEADLILREAREKAHRTLADSSSRVERVQESYEVLRKSKQEFTNDFRRLLRSYMDVMDNVDVASAKEIEASLRERLDTESIAAAREAAETRRMGRDETATQETGPLEGTEETQRMESGAAEDVDETRRLETGDTEEARRVETVATPSVGTNGGDATGDHGPQPEAEEPEVEPSSVGDAPRNASTPAPGDTEEVDREEPMPAGQDQGRAADDFFGQEGGGRNDAEERKIFRASRFLRRRG